MTAFDPSIPELALKNLSESDHPKTSTEIKSKDLESIFICDSPPTQDYSAIDTSNADFSSEMFTADTPVVNARMNIVDHCLNNDGHGNIQMDPQDFVSFNSNDYGMSAAFENEDIGDLEREILSSDYHAGFNDTFSGAPCVGPAKPSDHSPVQAVGEERKEYRPSHQYTEVANIDSLNGASSPMFGATLGYLPISGPSLHALPSQAVDNHAPFKITFPPNSDSFLPSEEGIEFATELPQVVYPESPSHVQDEADRGPMDYLSNPASSDEAISAFDNDEPEEHDSIFGQSLRASQNGVVDGREPGFQDTPSGITFPPNDNLLPSKEGVEFATTELPPVVYPGPPSHAQYFSKTDQGSMDYPPDPAYPGETISTFDIEPEQKDLTFGWSMRALQTGVVDVENYGFQAVPSGITFLPNNNFLPTEQFAMTELPQVIHIGPPFSVQDFFESKQGSVDSLSDPAPSGKAIPTIDYEPEEDGLSSTYWDGVENTPHAIMFSPNNELPTTSEGTELAAAELVQTVDSSFPDNDWSQMHNHAPRSTFDCGAAGEQELSGHLHGAIGDTPDQKDGMMECYPDQSDHVMLENQDWMERYNVGQSDHTMLENNSYNRDLGEVDSFLKNASYYNYLDAYDGDDELIDGHLFDVPLPENPSPHATHIHTLDIPYAAAVPGDDNQDQWDGQPSVFHGNDMSTPDHIEAESHRIWNPQYEDVEIEVETEFQETWSANEGRLRVSSSVSDTPWGPHVSPHPDSYPLNGSSEPENLYLYRPTVEEIQDSDAYPSQSYDTQYSNSTDGPYYTYIYERHDNNTNEPSRVDDIAMDDGEGQYVEATNIGKDCQEFPSDDEGFVRGLSPLTEIPDTPRPGGLEEIPLDNEGFMMRGLSPLTEIPDTPRPHVFSNEDEALHSMMGELTSLIENGVKSGSMKLHFTSRMNDPKLDLDALSALLDRCYCYVGACQAHASGLHSAARYSEDPPLL
ncbi:hypothetical protein F5877DRAFT_85512 [Lentinula edodes]|nr:hypothetical protein F5877DRAFT_85512 [Lentinula edodes]